MKADSGYKTFADLPGGMQGGGRVVQRAPLVWQALAKDLDGCERWRRIRATFRWLITDFDPSHRSSCMSGDLCAGVTSIYNAIGPPDGRRTSWACTTTSPPRSSTRTTTNPVTRVWTATTSSSSRAGTTIISRVSGVLPFGLATRAGRVGARTRQAILEAYPDDFGYTNDAELAYRQ